MAQQRERHGSRPWTVERIYDLFPRLRERHAQFAGTLSGGEQQMLAIGRALMGNPRVLLLDEPSEGLAPLIVAEVGRTIRRLKEEGQSIILVEQNLQLALDVADQAVILNTGRCVFTGKPATAEQRRTGRAKSRRLSCSLGMLLHPLLQLRSGHENRRMRNRTNGIIDRAAIDVGRP